MEVPQVSIKQERVENFTVATELNVDDETNILDSMEIKVEPVKIEPIAYESESNNLDGEVKLSKKAKMNENNDEDMLDSSSVEKSTIEKILELKDSCSLTDQKRLEIKRNGRPTPVINLKQTTKDRGKEVTRHFRSSMYDLCEWICGCHVKKAFFCFPCVLMCNRSKEHYLWTEEGVTDIKHLREKINKHSLSPLHISNVISFSCLGHVDIALRLDGAYRTSIKHYNEKVTQNRYILSKIIDCIKLCGSFECVLWNDDEITESTERSGMIFPGIVDFVSELDGILREHLEKNAVFRVASQTIREDLLESFLTVTQELIRAEVGRAKFVAIQVDEVTDTTNKNQLVFIVRYVFGGKIRERFWKFIKPRDSTARALADEILTELNALEIGKTPEKLIAQCYDGANTGYVQTTIQNKYPAAHFVHCYAHHLNLIIQKAASQHKEIRVFFANLQAFSVFFGKCPRRTMTLNEVLRKRLMSPESTLPRWNFNTKCIETVYIYKCDLINCFEELLTTEVDSATINQAGTLRMLLENDDFLYWLNFFQFFMPHVETLYSQLQKSNINIASIDKHIKEFNVTIRNIRVHVITFINDVGTGESRRRVSLEICDMIMSEIGCRFNHTDHLVISRLFHKDNFARYKTLFPGDVLNAVKKNYPKINSCKLISELVALYNRKEFYNSVSAIAILQLLVDMNLVEAFSESVKLLDILCTMPMATTESERCFTTSKRIKTFWRNTVGESRHSALAMLSLEKPLIRSTANFNELVVEQFARQRERTIDLLYKHF